MGKNNKKRSSAGYHPSLKHGQGAPAKRQKVAEVNIPKAQAPAESQSKKGKVEVVYINCATNEIETDGVHAKLAPASFDFSSKEDFSPDNDS